MKMTTNTKKIDVKMEKEAIFGVTIDDVESVEICEFFDATGESDEMLVTAVLKFKKGTDERIDKETGNTSN